MECEKVVDITTETLKELEMAQRTVDRIARAFEAIQPCVYQIHEVTETRTSAGGMKRMRFTTSEHYGRCFLTKEEACSELPKPDPYSNRTYVIVQVNTCTITSGYAIHELMRTFLEKQG